MAHQFTDSFCTITSSAISPYETVSGTVTYSSTYTRFPAPSGCQAGGVKLAANAYMRKNLSSNQATLIAFLSVGQLALPPTQQSAIIVFLDSGTYQTGLQVTAAGALQFVNGITNVGPASAPGLINVAPGTAPNHGIEIKITISSSVGTVDCWLDGVHVITGTGLNTQNSAHAYANQVQIGGPSGGFGGSDQGFYCDYLRVWDSTGSTQNAPVGLDVQPITKLPNAAGTNSQFTPNGFVNNYQCVSVIPPSGSDYVSTSTAGIVDDYKVATAGMSLAPSQVVVTSYYQKTDGATRTYTNGVLSGTSTGTGTVFTANAGLTWVQNCITTDPATSAAWTAAGADTAHILHTEVS